MVEMTDFYSVLQRAVSTLPDSSGPNRRAVYDKARKALLKQLQSFDPPLPSSDVTAQRLSLEDAIRKIENEIARQIRTQRALQTAIPSSSARPRPGALSQRSGNVTDPETAARLAEEERERAALRAAEAERARKQNAELLTNAISEATLSEPLAEDGSPPAGEAPRQPGPETEALRSPPVPVSPRADLGAQLPEEGSGPGEADMFEADADYDRAEPFPHPPAPRDEIVDGEFDEVDELAEAAGIGTEELGYEVPDRREPKLNRRDERRRKKEEEQARKDEARRLKAEQRAARKKSDRSREPVGGRAERAKGKSGRRMVLAVVLLLLCVGAGYAVYSQSGSLLAAITDLREDDVNRPPISVTGVPVEKNADRLPSIIDGEDTRPVTTTAWPPQDAEGADGAAPAPQEPAEGASPRSAVPSDAVPPADRTVGTDVSPFTPESAEARAPLEPQSEVAALPQDGQSDAVTVQPLEQPSEAPETAALPPPAVPAQEEPAQEEPRTPIADVTPSGTQQAVLFEEANQAGERGPNLPGGVEWSMVSQSIGGGDPEPVIRATAEIPEKDMKAIVTIRENLDSGLPASHLIEIEFQLAEGFSGNGVQNVPGIIMKENYEARGDALEGAAARVSAGLFWVALSVEPGDQERNLALLRDRDWMDIPILYENGRRAILTLRKGSDGFESVSSAINAWGAN
ncbi:MAG: hypothetical protein AAGB11_07465 [Pseudomonadota bacterium]